jgi:hypothetical protein
VTPEGARHEEARPFNQKGRQAGAAATAVADMMNPLWQKNQPFTQAAATILLFYKKNCRYTNTFNLFLNLNYCPNNINLKRGSTTVSDMIQYFYSHGVRLNYKKCDKQLKSIKDCESQRSSLKTMFK